MLALLLALNLTDPMWEAARPTYQKTIEHPFLRELADGTLSRERFERYLIEDIAYLKAYGEVLTALAVKAPKASWKKFLLDGAAACETEMKHIHETYLGGREKSKAPSAANAAYIRFLRLNVEQRSFAEGLAAVLPCYWIYWEVGKTLQARGSRNPDYQRWIDYYSDPAYGKVVRQVLQIMNEAGSGLESKPLIELFVMGAEFEYQFWDSAYHLRL